MVGGVGAGVVAASVLKVGRRVVAPSLGLTDVAASVTSSASSKVSPRATEGRTKEGRFSRNEYKQFIQ